MMNKTFLSLTQSVETNTQNVLTGQVLESAQRIQLGWQQTVLQAVKFAPHRGSSRAPLIISKYYHLRRPTSHLSMRYLLQ